MFKVFVVSGSMKHIACSVVRTIPIRSAAFLWFQLNKLVSKNAGSDKKKHEIKAFKSILVCGKTHNQKNLCSFARNVIKY